jgi:hypothetical protein
MKKQNKKTETFMCPCGEVHKESEAIKYKNWLLCKRCYKVARFLKMTESTISLLRYFDHKKFEKTLKYLEAMEESAIEAMR